MQKRFSLTDAPDIARYLLEMLPASSDRATILALSGELGAGKTTLTQAIGSLLGVEEMIVSPTFVVMKRYETKNEKFASLVHIDAYRIEHQNELTPLRFESIINQGNTLIVIEWPERVAGALKGEQIASFRLTHHEGDERSIEEV